VHHKKILPPNNDDHEEDLGTNAADGENLTAPIDHDNNAAQRMDIPNHSSSS
jgi:hypothetical protein